MVSLALLQIQYMICYPCDAYNNILLFAGLFVETYVKAVKSANIINHVHVFSRTAERKLKADVGEIMTCLTNGAFAAANGGPTVVDEDPETFSIVTKVSSVITTIVKSVHEYGGEAMPMVYCDADFIKKEVSLRCSRGACKALAQKTKWKAGKKVVISCKHVKSAWVLIGEEFATIELCLDAGL